MLFRLFHPEVFQGSLGKRNYFEGWYFKHVTGDESRTLSVIPGISLGRNDPHAFIQVMDGYEGTTSYIRYGLNEFRWDRKKMLVQVGSSEFTGDHSILYIKSDNMRLTGRIDYRNSVKYPKTLFSPGIMGWYSFVPFMECRHGIVSVNHDLRGRVSIQGRSVDFRNGKGYIEKDWGTSFPESWLWIQSNNFNERDTSFSCSIAKIPWLGSFFIGFIAFLHLRGKFCLFTSYNRSEILEAANGKDSIGIILRNKKHTIRIRVIKNSFGELKAPVSGEMSRQIRESIDSVVHIGLYDKSGRIQYEGTGRNVGLEVIEKIFDYFLQPPGDQ